MSVTLIDESHVDALAARLGADLCAARRDPFDAPLLLVPNGNIRQWLQLELAKWAPADAPNYPCVAMNFDIRFIEAGLWELLAELDGAENRDNSGGTTHELRTAQLTRERIQWMILAVLDAQAARTPRALELAPIFGYLGTQRSPGDCIYARKKWQLSDKLSRLFRQYEFDAPDMIREWLDDDAPDKKASASAAMNVCQRFLYRIIFAPGGLRDACAGSTKTRWLSLPQYARELRTAPCAPLTKGGKTVRIFLLPQLAPAHSEVLSWISEYVDLHIYALDAEARFSGLRRKWGVVEAARARRVGEIISSEFQLSSFLPPVKGGPGIGKPKPRSHDAASVLERLQHDLRQPVLPGSKISKAGASERTRMPQDHSLQIAACPSIRRELESIYNSIIHNLKRDPELKLTDIAVLIPDMAAYKPIVESVFRREPRMLAYNLIDSTAADDSVFAQAVMAVLNLASSAQEFTRKDVFDLILNPCFLAAQNIDRDDALVWLDWADKLNIFRGASATGGATLDPFTWTHGLRRLRLGRLMEAPHDNAFAAYNDIAPFVDMESQSPAAVARFSLAIEHLTQAVNALREECRSVKDWVAALEASIERFIKIPADRKEEEQVARILRQQMRDFVLLDTLLKEAGKVPGPQLEAGRMPAPQAVVHASCLPPIPLPLLEACVNDNLISVPSRTGHYLLDGVTISALKPERPFPFKIVYIAGLSEGQFPGVASDTALELARGAASAADANRQAFLEAVLAARQRLYLSYVSKDLQKDETFAPCSVVNELKRHIEENILAKNGDKPSEFKIAEIPLAAASYKFVFDDFETASTDLLERNYWTADNRAIVSNLSAELDGLILAPAARATLQTLGAAAQREAQRRNLKPSVFAAPAAAPPSELRVTVRDLAKFLENPVEICLQRRLRLYNDKWDDPAFAEDEPLASEFPHDYELLMAVMRQIIVLRPPAPKIDSAAREILDDLHRERFRRAQAPAGAFGGVDRARLFARILQALAPNDARHDGLAAFLDSVAPLKHFNVAVGRLSRPERVAGAEKIAFSPVILAPAGGPRISVHADVPLVWCDPLTIAGKNGSTPHLLVLAPNANSTKSTPSKHALQPFLFYMVMRAGAAREASVSSAEWIGPNGFRVSIQYSDCRREWHFPGISPQAARDYLTRLALRFLKEESYDCLPFAAITKAAVPKTAIKPWLRETVREPIKYKLQLEDAIDRARESDGFSGRTPQAFIDLIDSKVPDNAFDEVKWRMERFFAAVRVDAKTPEEPDEAAVEREDDGE